MGLARAVLAVAGSVFERLVEAPSCCLLCCWTSRSSLVARCPWVDSTCARCANESPDESSASSRQGWVAGAVQLASHTAESPWSGHFASSVPVRPQPAGRRLIACSLPGSTGGSAGVPLADEAASPSSTTAQAYPHRAQEGRGERYGVGPGHRLERLRTHLCFNSSPPSLRGGLAWEFIAATGLGGAVCQPGRHLRPSDESRERPQDSRPATALLSLSPSLPGFNPHPGWRPAPPSLVVTTHSQASPPRNDGGLLLKHKWVRSLSNLCPGPTPHLSPPASWAH